MITLDEASQEVVSLYNKLKSDYGDKIAYELVQASVMYLNTKLQTELLEASIDGGE